MNFKRCDITAYNAHYSQLVPVIWLSSSEATFRNISKTPDV